MSCKPRITKEGTVLGLGEQLQGAYEMGPFECLIIGYEVD